MSLLLKPFSISFLFSYDISVSWLLRMQVWTLRTGALRHLTSRGEKMLPMSINIFEFPNVKLVAFACRKKKGTQSEAITLAEKLAQASNIDIFESTSQAFQDSGCWKFSENERVKSFWMASKFKIFALIVVKKKNILIRRQLKKLCEYRSQL